MRPDGSATTAAGPAGPAWLRPSHALAVVVLLLSLAAVFYYAQSRREREMHAAQLEFEGRAAEVVERIRRRVGDYDLILRGGVSLFASVDWPSTEQWSEYYRSLRIEQQFPSIVGLGFAPYLPSGQLPAFQNLQRERG